MEKPLSLAIYASFVLLAVDCIDDLFLGNRWVATALLVGLATASITAYSTYGRLKNGKGKE